ncbi:hypothetical protein PHYSODRAFT_487565 [Phytophthora sojae]|uniref:Calcineurin-like phosphoesterase domain-containing protein n=1 Tax=Phytophthora sojae (strain P6497) TaxID=1094619 RepID=G4YUU9_PHYSP|nr:hypothetical protein PHYSODRAFT_487565 [Phytophthora sojae]EGZ26024.1 hypothetical protein PHYSODRAFT_487565 [Phytophthora sojae]|eukprot:XP_009521312.1 hypothetical protein PHYSODRAFT_487565 [Phytophthora sojae]
MSLTNLVLRLVPHDASPEQLAARASGFLCVLVLLLLFSTRQLFGSFIAHVITLLLLGLTLRWLYWNGVGVLGWDSPYLRNSEAVVRSLSSHPQQEGTLRVVCISDTHSKHRNLSNVPEGDVLLHCGDFTQRGTHAEIRDFNDWLGTLPHKHKLVIAGNHDVSMDAVEYDQHWDKAFRHKEYNDPSVSRALLTNCTYLENRSVVIEGVKIYGSPMTPPIHGRQGAFNVARGFADQQHWAKVPADVDMLVTHGPPHGILDTTFTGLHVGSETLLKETMSRIRPSFHIFGHIHEAYGATRVGKTVFVNAASSTLLSKPKHAPVVVDIPIKC